MVTRWKWILTAMTAAAFFAGCTAAAEIGPTSVLGAVVLVLTVLGCAAILAGVWS